MNEKKETIIRHGGAAKALDEPGRVGGYLVMFGDAKNTDLEGDFFTKDTDFGTHSTTPIYYHHGMDGAMKRREIGNGTLSVDDVGVWIEAQLDMRDRYERAIYDMTVKGRMGWSSGTATHLVEAEPVDGAFWLKMWKLGLDASLTPTPAESRIRAIPLKSLPTSDALHTYISSKSDTEPEASAEAEQSAPDAGQTPTADKKTIIEMVEDTMSENQQTPPADQTPDTSRLDALEGNIKALTDNMTTLSGALETALKFMQEEPGIKHHGYFSDTGGSSDEEIKSFGDFLLSVSRGDTKRLSSVYKSTKDMSGESGTSGGYLVPHTYHQEIMRLVFQRSPLLERVYHQPVTTPSGSIPALDQFVAPTPDSGNTAEAAGITTSGRSEGESYTETEPLFAMIEYKVNDAASGLVPVPKELRQDARGIDALLRDLFRIAVTSKLEYLCLMGSGVGQPHGMLNAAAALAVSVATDNEFGYADSLNMLARFMEVSENAMWVMHRSLIPDVGKFEVGTGGAVFHANVHAAMPMSLHGYPMYFGQHLPQANNAKSAALIDPAAYALFELGEMYVDFSEHYYFGKGKDAWRFGQRVDGKSRLKNTIKQADSGNYEVSPFVYLDD